MMRGAGHMSDPALACVLDARGEDRDPMPLHPGASLSRACNDVEAWPMRRAVLACTACAARAAADARYFDHAFATPRRVQLTAESLADTLGYCAGHARALLRRVDMAAPAARAAHGALDRWIEMLGDECRFADRIGDVFFHAERDCPACKFAERAGAGLITDLQHAVVVEPTLEACEQLDGLCFAHFKHLYVDATPRTREWLFVHYRETLDRMYEQELHAHADAGPELREVLNCIAGEPFVSATDLASGALRLAPNEGACQVCCAVDATRTRWLNQLRPALRAGQSAWLAFPSCAEHVHAAVALGDCAITRAAAERAAAVALLILQRRLPPFTPPLANELERLGVPRVRRRRGKRASSRSKPPGRPRTFSVRCAACERMAVARDAAIARLLDKLQSTQQRATYATGYGLCLRHFASAYLIAERGATRAFLTDVQCQRLILARDQLVLDPARGDGSATRGLPTALVRLGGGIRTAVAQ